MKNIVFIVNIGGELERSKPYKYSVKSWAKWCEKNNCELVTLTERIYDKSIMNLNWHKIFVYDLLENEGIDYDQILTVDADTIVHPNAPNFFNLTEHKYCAVHNEGCYDWVCRSIENYKKHLFPSVTVPLYRYINSGFIISNKTHKNFFEVLKKYYFNNSDSFIRMQETYHVGTDQPVINFLLNKEKIDYKILPYEFNMQDLARKEILDNDFTFTKLGWVYHFNAIPQQFPQTAYWMEKTYEKLYK